MMKLLDQFAWRIFDPTNRVDFFKLLAGVDVVLGLLVLAFNAGTAKSMYQETGVPRFWFVALCWACAVLFRVPKSPGIYLLMIVPIFVYALGTIYTASLAGSWPDVLLFLFLIFQLVHHYAEEKDKFNGINTNAD